MNTEYISELESRKDNSSCRIIRPVYLPRNLLVCGRATPWGTRHSTSDQKQVERFERQLYLTIIKDCPIAHTMGPTFSYTTSVHLQQDIVYLPNLYKIDKWFNDDSLSSKLEENTLSRMNQILTSGLSDIDKFEDGIPLNTLIERIRHRSTRIASWYLAILQHIVAVLASLYILYKLYLQFQQKVIIIIIYQLNIYLHVSVGGLLCTIWYWSSKMFLSGGFLNRELTVKCLGRLLCRLGPLWLRYSNLGVNYWCLSYVNTFLSLFSTPVFEICVLVFSILK